MKYLVIAAHPDDDVLGVGGTIARVIEQGHEVAVLYLTDNTLRHRSPPVSSVFDLGKGNHPLEHYANRAMEVLGVSKWSCARLEDQGLWKTPDKVTAAIELHIGRFKPDVVFTHAKEDLNSDHRIVHEATLVATRAHKHLCDVYAYGTHGGNHGMHPRVQPLLYVKLEARHVDKKIKALEQFELEKQEHPHPRSTVVVRMVMSVTGSEVNTDFAEAFDVVRSVW